MLDRLYAVAPVWLQNAAVSAYGARLRFLRHGREYARELARLRETQWLSAAELLSLQQEAWRALREAAIATPMYRELWRDSIPPIELDRIAELPLLDGGTLREAGRRAVSALVHGRRLIRLQTGGTTGAPLTVYCRRAALQRNYAFYARLMDWAGLPEHPRTATFAGRVIVPTTQQGPPYWRSNRAGNVKLFSSFHISPDAIPHYVEELARFRPQLIDTYPSAIEPIARWILSRRHGDIRPLAIITSSESLTDHSRSLIEAAFGCRVHDFYGAVEMAAFISQCERGAYHPNPEFGVVEILSDGRPAEAGETGEIAASSFINPAMPLVRYATGDLATLGSEPCPCGRAFPVITALAGRSIDVLVTPEGRRVVILDPIWTVVDEVLECRMIQDDLDHVRIEVVLRAPLSAAGRNVLLSDLQVRLGPRIRLEVVAVEAIPRTERGKFRSVVNLVYGTGTSEPARSSPGEP